MMGWSVASAVTAVVTDYFSVKTFQGETCTVNFSENTDFHECRNPITLADVKMGDKVRIQDTLSGDTVTASIVNGMRANRQTRRPAAVSVHSLKESGLKYWSGLAVS